MSKKLELRMFEIMNECERIDVHKIIEWLQGMDCKYLIVKHDMDLPRAPHYHVFVKMISKRTISDIARFTGVEKNFINKIEKGWKNALAYAFHLTENAEKDGKYKYTQDAIVSYANVDINEIFKLSEEYKQESKHKKQVEELLFKYGECEITKSEVMARLGAQDYYKHSVLFKRMQEYRIMKVRERNMKVIYITGGAGSGKTTLAKFIASTMNYDVFVSGSGKDILDGYDKEECIILDDLRADVFTKAELFKLTDNNTNSSVKSRFRNKDISYCKLMIITSIYDPMRLYKSFENDVETRDEPFKQFARRFGNKFLWIDDRNGVIYECLYEPTNYELPTLKTRSEFTMAQVFEVLGIKSYLGDDLFKDIMSKVKERIDDKANAEKLTDDLPF